MRVSQDDYYTALLDRQMPVNYRQVNVLAHYCAYVYPDVRYSEAYLMIEVVMSMRRRKYFTYVSTSPERVIVESVTDCARTAARAVIPYRGPAFYRQFVDLPADKLRTLFIKHGVTVHEPHSWSLRSPPGVVLFDKHVIALI